MKTTTTVGDVINQMEQIRDSIQGLVQLLDGLKVDTRVTDRDRDEIPRHAKCFLVSAEPPVYAITVGHLHDTFEFLHRYVADVLTIASTTDPTKILPRIEPGA